MEKSNVLSGMEKKSSDELHSISMTNAEMNLNPQ